MQPKEYEKLFKKCHKADNEDKLDILEEIIETTYDETSKEFILRAMIERIQVLDSLRWHIQRDIAIDQFLSKIEFLADPKIRIHVVHLLKYKSFTEKIFGVSADDPRFVSRLLDWARQEEDIDFRRAICHFLEHYKCHNDEQTNEIVEFMLEICDDSSIKHLFYFLLNIAHTHFENKDYDKALENYKRVHTVLPNVQSEVLARWIFNRSSEFRDVDEYELEIAYTSLIIELFSTDQELQEFVGASLCNKATASAKLGQFSQTKQLFEQYFDYIGTPKTIEMHEQKSLAMYQQALFAYDKNEEYDRANELYRELIKKYKSWTKYNEIQDNIYLAMQNLIINLDQMNKHKEANEVRKEWIEHFESTRDMDDERAEYNKRLADQVSLVKKIKNVFGLL